MANQITILGAETAVGSYVLYLLSKLGYQCHAPLIHPHRHSYLKFNNNIILSQFNPLSTNEISLTIKESTKVLNFFRAYESNLYNTAQLETHNHFFCKYLSQLCIKNKIQRLIHHSSLGISQFTINNPYLLSRSYGEKALLSNVFTKISIVRSSWYYGNGVEPDGASSCFVKHIANDLQRKKFYPLIGQNIHLSPIHIKELAELFVSLVTTERKQDKQRIEAIGHDTLTLNDVVKKIHHQTNSKAHLYPYPLFLASRLVKKHKVCGALFPVGTKDFKLSLTASDSKNQQTLHQSSQGILDYIEALN